MPCDPSWRVAPRALTAPVGLDVERPGVGGEFGVPQRPVRLTLPAVPRGSFNRLMVGGEEAPHLQFTLAPK